MTTRSGWSSSFSSSTCSSVTLTSSSGDKYAARVHKPSGGKREYLIGRKSGLFASVKAGKIIFTFIGALVRTSYTFPTNDRNAFARSKISSHRHEFLRTVLNMNKGLYVRLPEDQSVNNRLLKSSILSISLLAVLFNAQQFRACAAAGSVSKARAAETAPAATGASFFRDGDVPIV